jgi:4-aminobutyrate--pyruvate transaminase
VALQVASALQRGGILLRAVGDNLYFSPPLIISENEIGHLFGVLGDALDEVERTVRG